MRIPTDDHVDAWRQSPASSTAASLVHGLFDIDRSITAEQSPRRGAVRREALIGRLSEGGVPSAEEASNGSSATRRASRPVRRSRNLPRASSRWGSLRPRSHARPHRGRLSRPLPWRRGTRQATLPLLRVRSPRGDSTLTTSAPMSASNIPASGAAMICESSSTRVPLSGPSAIVTSLRDSRWPRATPVARGDAGRPGRRRERFALVAWRGHAPPRRAHATECGS